MPGPAASVILPTHDSASTLPYALRSVQEQSEGNLEILLVLDGSPPACKEIAYGATRSDTRIKVLDRAKDAHHGVQNIHDAVLRAQGNSIFYIDDDDLWLPNHVARLTPFLEHADIADSRTASLDRRGKLHLTPCGYANDRMRTLLAEGIFKSIYDTHIAHRKDAYGRFSTWVTSRPIKGSVWNFLAGFAAQPDCRWVSCNDVTAISLHGAARRDMPAEARAEEIARFAALLPNAAAYIATATTHFHLFRLLTADPPSQGEAFASYLAVRGAYKGVGTVSGENALFALFGSKPPSDDAAAELATELAEPVESTYLSLSIAAIFFQAYGLDRHEAILAAAADRTAHAGTLASYSAAMTHRDVTQALALARKARAIGPDPVGALAGWVSHLSEIVAERTQSGSTSS